MPAYDKTRIKIAAFVTAALSLLLLCPVAFALDPSLDASQYAHTAWLVREGFTKGYIRSIVQTADGYIWLGTGFGLFRFDGVRVALWQPPVNGEQLPSNFVTFLRVAHDGTLWIGTMEGLASWRGGRLTRYPDLAGSVISSILEGHHGMIWVGSYSLASYGKLCAINGKNVNCDGLYGELSNGVNFLYEDSRDVLWVVGRDGVWRWRPGPPRFYHLPSGTYGVQALGEAGDGTLLIPLRGRLARFAGGKLETQHPYPAPASNVDTTRFLRDHDGGIWIGTAGAGVVHIHNGRVDVFSQADGLSGDIVISLFEDREGDVWVGTLGGLDRFRNCAIATYSQHQGLGTVPGSGSVAAGRNGTIWVGTNDGLRMWSHGEVTIYGTAGDYESQSRTVWPPVRYVANRDVGNHLFVSVFEDRAGRILVATPHAFGYMENERFVPIRGVPGGIVYSVDRDSQGNLWIANQDQGLLRLAKDATVQRISWASIGHKDGAQSLAADRSTGGLWLGFSDGGVAYFSEGQVRETYGREEGLGNGRVSALHIDTDDTVWAGTEGGLSRIKNGRIVTLTSKNGLPCDAIHWITQDENRSLWLYMACGLVRIGRSELDTWVADSQRTVRTTVFDSSEGVSNIPITFHAGSLVTRSLDGKIWFDGFLGGVSVIDPRHLQNNEIMPPTHIESITANGKAYDPSNGLHLPARIRDLKIDYTALSFVAPEKVQFRFKLEGQDLSLRQATNDREVQYSNLAPGNYVFRVTAANNSGLWNEAGDTLDFSIAPAYYQTNWFRAVCLAAVLVLVCGLHRLRLHQLQLHFNAGLEARVSERTRIARELHDTLLQSFQGLLMRFQAVSNELAEGEAKQELDGAIDRAARAITEGRDAVQGLRSSAVLSSDLAAAIGALAKELPAVDSRSSEFTVQVEGAVRELHPILRDEVYRVAGEALRNAFRHADARHIEVEIRYDERRFRLRVRDDGKGIDPKLLVGNGRAGHFGLRGMRERANRVGGKLTVWSELQAGTEVELSIPAAHAYTAFRAELRGS